MDIEINGWGVHVVTLSTGATLRMAETKDGRLEIRATDGFLAVFPKSTNVLEIAALGWDGVEVKS